MTNRKSISRTVRVRVFERAGGLCHLCRGKISAADKWDVDHILPLALGGADDESNFAPAHNVCHREKSKVDVGRIRKADRQRAAFIGAKKPSKFRRPAGVRFDWKQGRYVKETTT